MKRGLLFGVLVCLVVAWGCGGSDDDGGGGTESGGTIELGGECIVTAECKGKDVTCRCDGAGPTKCTALLAPGSACADQSECPSTTLCINRGSGATCELLKLAGEACTTQELCAAGSTCREGVCAAAGGEGTGCDNFEPQPCVAGFYCDFFDELCVAAAPEGGECGGDDECVDGVCYSQGGPQVCHPRRKEGEACESSFQCPDGYDCDNDVCTKPTSPTTCS